MWSQVFTIGEMSVTNMLCFVIPQMGEKGGFFEEDGLVCISGSNAKY